MIDLKSIRHEAAAALRCAPDDLLLLLRTCSAAMRSYGDFTWPERGLVSAPDWSSRDCCGYGLHGLPRGEGKANLLSKYDDAKWLVWAAVASEVVPITEDGGGKSKAPRGFVVFAGDRAGAIALIQGAYPSVACVFGTATAGYAGTATAGDDGTATAGYAGTATAGYAGTATAGDAGTATAGDAGTATAGDDGTATAGARGTATAGARGTATAGDAGTATAGYAGTATAGDGGTATAGARGTATAGDGGIATAGYAGTATAGDDGSVSISWWDHVADRRRRKLGECGIDVLSYHAYRVSDSGEWIDLGDVREMTTVVEALLSALTRSATR